MLNRILASAALAGVLMLGQPAQADEQELVDSSARVLEQFLADADVKRTLERARGLMIIPDYVKAGFIIGGAGGDGVMMLRRADGSWTYPAFYEFGGGSVGLQIGAAESEILMLFMTDAGLDQVIDEKLVLGGSAGATVMTASGQQSGSVSDDDVDIITYVRARGAFVGATIEGGHIDYEDDENRDYYGRGASARAILIDNAVSNPGADRLRGLLAGK
ncbi:MAG: lipid-binding SYLF domain-containing protein [Kiloniellales bacterium]